MNSIKKALVQKDGYVCSLCNLTSWLNQPICLELDHIDGNHLNNQSENLRLLCPNCHSQTETFRGRNINKGVRQVSDDILLAALQESTNIRQALIRVGLTPKGLNYKRASRLLNLDYINTKDTKNSQYNTLWINNGSVNKKISKANVTEYTNNNWQVGRLINTKPPSAKGKYWITNGIESKLVAPKDIPEGWWKGRH